MDQATPNARSRPLLQLTLIGLLALLALAAYANSFLGVFVLDDIAAIEQNAFLEGEFPWQWFEQAASRPLLFLTLWGNYQWGALNPWGYHVVNLALHGLAGVLLYFVIERTLAQLHGEQGYVSPLFAWSVAALWLVHPLQTECVTYVVQRGEVLVGLFTFACLYCVIRGANSPYSIFWHLLAIAACGLGMASKRAMVATPFLVLLYDWGFLVSQGKDFFVRRKLLYAGMFAVLVWGAWEPLTLARNALAKSDIVSRPVLLTVSATAKNTTAKPHAPSKPVGFAIPTPDASGQRNMAGFRYQGVTPWGYLRSQPAVLLHYLQLTVWPDQLCLDYWWPIAEDNAGTSITLGIAVFLFTISVVGAWKRKVWGFLALAFFVLLAPRSTLIPRYDLAVEHRMYLPLACVLAALVWGMGSGLQILASRWNGKSRWPIYLAIGLVLVSTTGLIARTQARNRDYQSAQAIWMSTVQVRPHNPRAHYNLAVAYEAQGEIALAVSHYREAITIAPDYLEAHFNLGQWLIAVGEPENGLPHLSRAAELARTLPELQIHCARAFLAHDRDAQAVDAVRRALDVSPNHPEAWELEGILQSRRGEVAEAIVTLTQALELNSTCLQARLQLAELYLRQKNATLAISAYREAVLGHPQSAQAHRGLANSLMAGGQIPEAWPHYRSACQLAPQDAANRVDWGRACFLQRRFRESIEHFQVALKIDPDDPQLQIHLASALAEAGELESAAIQYRQVLKQLPADSTLAIQIQAWLVGRASAKKSESVIRQ